MEVTSFFHVSLLRLPPAEASFHLSLCLRQHNPSAEATTCLQSRSVLLSDPPAGTAPSSITGAADGLEASYFSSCSTAMTFQLCSEPCIKPSFSPPAQVNTVFTVRED